MCMTIDEQQKRLEWHLKWAVKAFGLWLLCFFAAFLCPHTWVVYLLAPLFFGLVGVMGSIAIQLNQIDEEKGKDAK